MHLPARESIVQPRDHFVAQRRTHAIDQSREGIVHDAASMVFSSCRRQVAIWLPIAGIRMSLNRPSSNNTSVPTLVFAPSPVDPGRYGVNGYAPLLAVACAGNAWIPASVYDIILNVVDAGMTDLARPALYGAIHPITKVRRENADRGAPRKRVDVVGPVCETGDCFLHDWPLGEVQTGDVLAIWVAGAYGMAQASNYNARCRPAEVLVEGKRFRLIRRRETQDDLLRTDSLAK